MAGKCDGRAARKTGPAEKWRGKTRISDVPRWVLSRAIAAHTNSHAVVGHRCARQSSFPQGDLAARPLSKTPLYVCTFMCGDARRSEVY